MNKRFFLVSLTVIVLIFLFSFLFLHNKNNSNIEANSNSNNKIVKTLESPDKKKKAIAYIRDLGATTAFSPQVSILKSGQNLGDTTGNVFIGNHSDFIDIYWEDNSSLVVVYDCKDNDIAKKIDNIDNVKITYKKSDRNN